MEDLKKEVPDEFKAIYDNMIRNLGGQEVYTDLLYLVIEVFDESSVHHPGSKASILEKFKAYAEKKWFPKKKS